MAIIILLNSGVSLIPAVENINVVSYCQDAMDSETDKEENTSIEIDDKVQPSFYVLLLNLNGESSRVAYYSNPNYWHHPDQISPPPERKFS